jgi:hypothetical protein
MRTACFSPADSSNDADSASAVHPGDSSVEPMAITPTMKEIAAESTSSTRPSQLPASCG